MDSTSFHLQGSLKCLVCNTTFTEQSYYDNHKGTRKHKRNVRKARKAVYERGFSGQLVGSLSIEGDAPPSSTSEDATNQQPLGLSNLTGLCDYKGVRENYRQKNNKYFEDYYTTYVSSTIAYWAVNLALNPTIQDFKITINDRNWDDFGDAVVELQFKELPEKLSSSARCAIHFKHIVSNNVKSLDSFNEGRFSFEGIARQVGKIKGKEENEIKDTRFFVFTTAAASPSLDTALTVRCCQGCRKPAVTCKCQIPNEESSECQENICVYAKTLSNRRNLVLNTSEDNESVYRFFPKDNSYTLPKIYVYSCQKKLRDFTGAIEEIVSDSFAEKRLQIARDFIKYIENWGKGRCGGFYKLKKEEVLVKLCQMLLAPFRLTPEIKAVEGPASRFTIWIQAIKSVDITILRPAADLSKLLEPFDLLIEKELALKINTTNDTVKIVRTKEQDDTKKVQNPILRAYLIEDTLRDSQNDIPLEKVYLMFWKAGLMPLVLQAKNEMDQDYVFQVVNVLKNSGLTRRYFVKTNDGCVQTSVKTLKSLSFFVNLSDISDKLGLVLLSNVRIEITDNYSISLADIEQSDKFFKRTVSASELFDMTLGNYVFKSFSYGSRQREDENTKLTLGNELMARFKYELESRGEFNNVLVRERTRNDVFANNWLRGVNPDLFL